MSIEQHPLWDPNLEYLLGEFARLPDTVGEEILLGVDKLLRYLRTKFNIDAKIDDVIIDDEDTIIVLLDTIIPNNVILELLQFEPIIPYAHFDEFVQEDGFVFLIPQGEDRFEFPSNIGPFSYFDDRYFYAYSIIQQRRQRRREREPEQSVSMQSEPSLSCILL
jgi:hypothetical protein